jgi:hypothetical protein
MDPIAAARALWRKTHPLPATNRGAGNIDDARAKASTCLAGTGVDNAVSAGAPKGEAMPNASGAA